jgi:thymidylate synthase
MSHIFNDANNAFYYYYHEILIVGKKIQNTKALMNVGFYICNPLDNEIKTSWRKWNKSYADFEFDWYLSGDRSVKEISKKAKIWDTMHDGDYMVNSNYGWQWNRNKQLQYVIDELKRDKQSRRAVLSIYDGKEHSEYHHDTPCTLSISFYIIDDKLNMTVNMRSNDLIYGFCNDQYCFSKLQEIIAKELNVPIGYYYHFANNLHIYEKHFEMHKR